MDEHFRKAHPYELGVFEGVLGEKDWFDYQYPELVHFTKAEIEDYVLWQTTPAHLRSSLDGVRIAEVELRYERAKEAVR